MIVHPGDLVRWNDEDLQVVAVRATYTTLRNAEMGEDLEVLNADLAERGEPATVRSTTDVLDLGVLDELPPADRKVVDVWLEELDRLSDLLEAGTKKTPAYQVTVDNVNRRLGTDYNAIKVTRQLAALDEFGVAGLLDRRRFGMADRPRSTQDPRLIEAIVSAMDGQTRASTGTADRLIWMVERDLETRYGKGAVDVPSRATVYRLMERLEAGRHTFGTARTRRTTANQPSHVFGNRTGMRPGEQVLIDTTPMEILVDCDGEQVRPDLTILLDECSRSVPGAIVTIGTRSIDLVVLLARALVPYAYRPEGVRANRRNIAQAWVGDDDLIAQRFEDARDAQQYIFPETITTDRGASYVSRHFTDACRTLGISLNLAAAYTPTQKAKIERMFRTIKNRFTQYVVSFLGESADMRGDERFPTDRLLTLEQLQELLEDWIAAIWQNRPHGSLRDPRHPKFKLSPNQMVSAYRQAVPELLIPLTADHYIALLPKKWRGIHHYGVNLDLRRYDSEALGTLRNKRSPDRRHAGQWPIHVDPYNPMIVWLQLEDEFIPLSWRSPYSNMPMADEIWRIARAQAAARGEEAPTNDDLNEVLRRFMSTGNKSLTSRERKRAKSNMTDPLGITNQLATLSPAPTDSEREIAPTSSDDSTEEAASSWPVAPPFGLTRQAEGTE
ncbi:MAG TPA: DDE-type integrase/transposase/recombinase [Microbacterium sp.]|jgi:putative transposase|uniref:DDE-type integrase/transposase/recombinase n=1 Tax=Microbacterium TaxID=33882 RepID=UPI000F8FB86A|nr:DDE-type integrase/transposase/recombinase [Microbacterium oxydans]AZS46028.1 hypothetical protein CVS53_00695 [Microbacterium oxydans]HWV48705.1 DDE-type integrase/transposase/recombinase [Microbacterium sp.]